MIFDFPHEPAPITLTTPFEDWCALVGMHPEDAGAWATYEHSIGAGSDHTPAAS